MSILILSIITLIQLVSANPIVRRATLAAGCDPVTRALAIGIQNNIAAQYQELSLTTQLESTVANNPIDANTFNVQKAQLVFTVEQGITLRQINQNIPTSNPIIIQNLNTLSNAQNGELIGAQQLGFGNQQEISNSLNTLVASFQGGIQLNTNTLVQALSSCPGGPIANGLANVVPIGNNGGNPNSGIPNSGIPSSGIPNGQSSNGQNSNGQNSNGQNGGNQNMPSPPSLGGTNSTSSSPTGSSGSENGNVPLESGTSGIQNMNRPSGTESTDRPLETGTSGSESSNGSSGGNSGTGSTENSSSSKKSNIQNVKISSRGMNVTLSYNPSSRNM